MNKLHRIARAAHFIAAAALLISSCACAASVEPFYKSEHIYQTIEGYPSCHGSTIAVAPNGDLVAAWYAGAFEKATDVAIFSSRIPKGGDQWTKPVVIHDTPNRSEGNPVLFTAPGGLFWLFYATIEGFSWNDCPIYAKSSTDSGITWGEPAFIRKKKGWMPRNKPLIMSDGRIILPLYDEALYRPQFMISDDNAKSWKYLSGITQSTAIQPSVIERSDGTLFCMMRDTAQKDIWQTESADKGKTWSKMTFSGLPNPDAATDMVKLSNGHIALAYNDSYKSRNPLTVAISTDEGRTWPYKRNLEADDTGAYAYPAIIQTPDGLIHVTFTYNRLTIKHTAFNEEWVVRGGDAGR